MPVGPPPVQDQDRSTWDENDVSGADAALTITHAAEAGKRHIVTGFEALALGAALGNDVTVDLQEGAVNRWRTGLGDASPVGERTGLIFAKPREFGLNTAVNLVAIAGGAGVTITLSMTGYTVPA
jgi:hypothetical protein